MKNGYVGRARKFIKSIYPYICLCRSYEEFDDCLDAWLSSHKKRKVELASGYSRICFATSDYVVKMDRPDIPSRRFGDCETEYSTYLKVKDTDYAYLFAPVTRIEHEGKYFYIMPRIKNVGKKRYEAEWYMNYEERQVLWKLGIGDRHSGNFGMKKKHVVFIDYAATV